MIAAYCWPQSALPGETISLCCHTNATTFQLEVIRQGKTDQQVMHQRKLKGCNQLIDEQTSQVGCDWSPSLDIIIAPEWPSGFYLIRLEDSEGQTADAFFVVRATEPRELVFVLSTSTWHAYNTWGGQSYYTGGTVVSPKRPLQPGFLQKAEPHRHRIARFKDWEKSDTRAFVAEGHDDWCMAGGWANWELLFARWLEANGYRPAYATSQDMDEHPDLLLGSTAYLSVGHDEYWSAGMRDTVEDFIEDGGNAAFFSGNTSFWQVRFSDNYTQMIGYKCNLQDDPVYDPASAPTLSTMWSDPLVGRPENRMTGVSFTRGGYAHMPNSPAGTGGYTIHQPGHWAFAGTGLEAGEQLGHRDIVVGYECDGCEFIVVDGKPTPTFIDGTPSSFEILGTAPARLWETAQAPDSLHDSYIGELNWVAERIGGEDSPAIRHQFENGNAVMGTFRKGRGEVFTAGCTDWAYGLQDSCVSRVTENVLKRFAGGS